MNRSEITKIKNLSERRQLPRLGKVRLGIKKIAKSGKEYPAEVDYFVCPPEVQKIYGEKPTELDVMFPVENENATFPQALKWYVAQGLRCKGDGERALRRVADLVVKKGDEVIDDARGRLVDEDSDTTDQNAMVEIQCPCPLLERGDCGENAALMVMLPKVSMGGVYQISTGSIQNIVRINSAIQWVRDLIGRVALVPLKLRRVPEVMEYEGKKATHFLLQLELQANIGELLQLSPRAVLARTAGLALPAPVEDGPDPAVGAIVLHEETLEPDAPASGGDDDLAFLDPPSDPPATPTPEPSAKSKTSPLKRLSEAAEAIGALVEGRGVLVAPEWSKELGIPAGIHNPRSLTTPKIEQLIEICLRVARDKGSQAGLEIGGTS